VKAIFWSLIVVAQVSLPPGASAPAPTGSPSPIPRSLAVVGARIYPAPDAAPIDDGVVVVESGVITAVGTRAATPIPAVERVIDGKGLVVTAGFQNSHVHFTDPRWLEAATKGADTLGAQLAEMLTRYGFTTVVDTASLLENTLALRRRIESGEVRGPRILTSGSRCTRPPAFPSTSGARSPRTSSSSCPSPQPRRKRRTSSAARPAPVRTS
jgi:imidazolonepropionase-like amidohydrolase